MPLRLALKTIKLLPLMIGWSTESISQRVFLIEHFTFSDPIRLVSVSIEKAIVPLYSATLHVNAHFVGLRYFMYYWFMSTATACIAAMWIASVGMLMLGEFLPTFEPFAVIGHVEGSSEGTEPNAELYEPADQKMPATRHRFIRSQIEDVDEEDEYAVPDRDSSNDDA